ncbi:aminotransferase class V-fold PLP-dependent enzyme [Gluconacetobacter tumulisoli]|uniref:Aminotransferase class V-fold PLP-dependent enzyme n=1 Tax=Gluconacetobacter tumulisoli TaxID=1286189 RepID=A0A7W4PL68_9PROT|nr:aminotransferase class V-fold PLP-dependent enzyme [Gluconacetobacter tumulisoli]MBB2201880.1 aminotransferase class V-fold PLP-dependent enzyme [Gluconacetobacter tumulisoli]
MSDPLNRWIAPARAETGVYLANAACGLASAPVLDAVMGHLRHEAERGAPWAAAAGRDRLDAGYADAARLIGARPDEIAFVESGNGALRALLLSVGLRDGERMLVDRACWGGTLAMLRGLDGVSVDVMATNAEGAPDITATRTMVRAGTRLVLTTWCPAVSGAVNPVEAIGSLAAEIGAVHLVDACQALGQIPVDVGTLRCDGLVASGRKWLRGPRGTALLYASRRFLARSRAVMADQFGAGREDARRYEGGEAFVAGRLGLATAIEGALALGVPFIRARIADRGHAPARRAARAARRARARPGRDAVGDRGVHDRRTGCDRNRGTAGARRRHRERPARALCAAGHGGARPARDRPAGPACVHDRCGDRPRDRDRRRRIRRLPTT